ncbi:hypothetical protein OAG32_03475, partial [Akkermansiaceae bacterium]|nr:hypothetical protein [Akkermansiaceae bacterium]
VKQRMSAKVGQESTRSRPLHMVRTPALALLILGTGITLLSLPPRNLKTTHLAGGRTCGGPM